MAYYRLPDYTRTTKSSAKYIKAWRDMAAPTEQKLGLTLGGFDPDFIFYKTNESGHRVSIELPLWFVRDLNKQLGSK